ncbi:MAG: hypothetical protein AB1467_02935 [Candidatus Diapherotrites archaeon]
MNKKFLAIMSIAIVMVALMPLMHAANLNIESVSYDPSPAMPGKEIKLWVHVKNTTTSTAKNAVFSLVLTDVQNDRPTSYPFYLPSDESSFRSLGDIEPLNSAVVAFRINVAKDALNADYNIFFGIGDEGQISKETKYTITILARKPQIELIESSVIELKPGVKTEVELKLKNIGAAKAINVLAGTTEDRTVTTTGVVVERQITPLGSSLSYLESIDTGKTASVKIVVSASTSSEAKLYTVPIKLIWYDENRTEYTATRYVGVRVVEDPALDLTIDSISPKAFPGGTSEITFNIFNVGSVAAHNIIIELDGNDIGSFDQTKFFIGSLESDDSDTVSTTVYFNKDLKPGQNELKLTAYYKNSFFEPKQMEKGIPLVVLTQSQAQALSQGGGSILLPAIIVIVILVIVVFLWRRRKKK